jgi:hypothetical protein
MLNFMRGNKGDFCIYNKNIFCQEIFCSECEIYWKKEKENKTEAALKRFPDYRPKDVILVKVSD